MSEKINDDDIKRFHYAYVRFIKDVGMYTFLIKRMRSQDEILKKIKQHMSGDYSEEKAFWHGVISFYWQPIIDYDTIFTTQFIDENENVYVNYIAKLIASVSLIETAKKAGIDGSIIDYGIASEKDYLLRMSGTWKEITIPKKLNEMFYNNEILEYIRNARV